MLSRETLERYRKMTPSERLQLTFELIEQGWQYMYVGTPDEVRRKRELVNRENDLANKRILETLEKTMIRSDHI